MTDTLKLRKSILERNYSHRNPTQRQAIFTTEGPVLVLAGAGSGKTTVLVERVAFLIRYGNAYFDKTPPIWDDNEIALLKKAAAGAVPPEEKNTVDDLLAVNPVYPWHILAITFTNKAANELKARLEQMLGYDTARQVTAGTFHSFCVRILRQEIAQLGYAKDFTIYDTDDAQRVMKKCMQELTVSDKLFPPKTVLNEISRAKDSMISPEEYTTSVGSDYRRSVYAKLYTAYQRKLKQSNAVDFDDLIYLTVQLFSQFPERLAHYQNRYRYLLVDEYQDTNHAQYRLVSLLAGGRKNLCVVGDDDQSIYKFRGATIENIMQFEEQFPGAKVIRLEQNYRSTQQILDAANHVIANNEGRKGKTLWTDKKGGEKITCYRAKNEQGEAGYIADMVLKAVAEGSKFSDHAVLYRMNAQSHTIEQQFVRTGIPYRIYGGTKFFERKEIRDLIAYFSVIQNPNDTVRLTRIINEPKRGIGDTTVAAANEIAENLHISLYEVLRTAGEYPQLGRRAEKLTAFTEMIERLREAADSLPLPDFYEQLLSETGYQKMLESQGEEGQMRLENAQELKSTLIKYTEENADGGLSGFLEEVALYTDLDEMNSAEDCVTMMTLHSAKGLEFPTVFIAGMEEDIFPSSRSKTDLAELEEERRLAYVGITRAKKKLYLLSASERMLYGSINRNFPSRFMEEIPMSLKDMVDAAFSLTAPVQSTQRMQKTPTYRSTIRKKEPVAGKPQAMNSGNFGVGDHVRHKAFGSGVILSAEPMGNDTLLEIRFDGVGIKKIMKNFAKLERE